MGADRLGDIQEQLADALTAAEHDEVIHGIRNAQQLLDFEIEALEAAGDSELATSNNVDRADIALGDAEQMTDNPEIRRVIRQSRQMLRATEN